MEGVVHSPHPIIGQVSRICNGSDEGPIECSISGVDLSIHDICLNSIKNFLGSDQVVLDAKLFPLVYWQERKQLWHTMPMRFSCAFRKRVTVITVINKSACHRYFHLVKHSSHALDVSQLTGFNFKRASI